MKEPFYGEIEELSQGSRLSLCCKCRVPVFDEAAFTAIFMYACAHAVEVKQSRSTTLPDGCLREICLHSVLQEISILTRYQPGISLKGTKISRLERQFQDLLIDYEDITRHCK